VDRDVLNPGDMDTGQRRLLATMPLHAITAT
jgi:hypothetical protein